MMKHRHFFLVFSLALILAGGLAAQTTLPVTGGPLTFNFTLGATTNPASQVLLSAPTGSTQQINWTVAVATTSGAGWLSATPLSAMGQSNVTVSVNPSGLATGTYKGSVVFAFNGGTVASQTVPVTLFVVTPLKFTGTVGGSIAPQSVTVTAVSGFSVSVQLFSGTNWLLVLPLSGGSGTSSVSVSANPGTLAAGTYTGQITLSIDGIPEVIPITLTISGPGLMAMPTTLSFVAVEGTNPANQSIALSSTVAGTSWTSTVALTPGQTTVNWLALNPSAGMLPATPSAIVTSEKLPAGVYTGTVSINASGAPLSVPVMLTVAAAPPGQLTVSPPAFNLQALASATGLVNYIVIGNTGETAITWTATATINNGGTWLQIFPSSGSAVVRSPNEFQFNITTQNLKPGVYTASIAFSAGTTTIQVPIQLTILNGPQSFIDQTGMTFFAAQGTGVQAAQTLTILDPLLPANTSTSFTASVLSGKFLKVTPPSGTITAGAAPPTVQITADATGLAPGAYYGLVSVTTAIPGTSINFIPSILTVVLDVLPTGTQQLSVAPIGLVFVGALSGGPPAAQTVNLSTTGSAAVPVSFTSQVQTSASWLTATPATSSLGNAVSGVSIGANQAGLGAGVYTGTVSVVPPSGIASQDIQVYLIVPPGSGTEVQSSSKPAAATCAPTQLVMAVRLLGSNFSSTVGFPSNIQAQMFDNCGNPAASGNVLASFSTPDPPLSLANLGNGIYSATWKPSTASPATVTIRGVQLPLPPVTQTVSGQVAANAAPPPSVTPSGVVNAASFKPNGGVAPCSIVSVFGTNLATSPGGNEAGFPLPTTLFTGKMTIGGEDAPLFYAGPGQVNAQVPCDLASASQAQVVARATNGTVESDAVPEPIIIAAVQPGIFVIGGTQGAIQNATGQFVDSTHPATAGDTIVIFCTGLGAVNPPSQTGQLPSSGIAVIQPTVTVGGVNAMLQYAGVAPGFAGLYQVNAVIPSGVTPGSSVPVILIQNGISSPTTPPVTIAVH